MMGCAQRIVGLLLIVFLVFGKAAVSEFVGVQEGGTATFKCSGEASGSICYVTWTILKNGLRTELADCDNNDDKKECAKTSNENECITDDQCQDTARCLQETEITNNSFTSQLEIKNVTPDFRHSVIECVMGDSSVFKSDDILIMDSYNISVLYQSVYCNATKYDTNVINISCKAAQVYPKITFRIFPEILSHISSDDQISVDKLSPQLSNVTSVNKRLTGSIEYFDAYCSAQYYPTQIGTFRFRVEILMSASPSNPVITITTNFVIINPRTSNCKHGLDIKSESLKIYSQNQSENIEIENQLPIENCNMPHVSKAEHFIENYKAFYLLMGSISTLAVTTFMIMSWAICTKRLSCKLFPQKEKKGNVYESIENVAVNEESNGAHSHEVGFSQSSEADTLFSDFSNEEEFVSSHRLAISGYVQNGPTYKSHTNCLTEGVCTCKNKTYIEPTTPTSTLSRSPDANSSFDTSDHCDTAVV